MNKINPSVGELIALWDLIPDADPIDQHGHTIYAVEQQLIEDLAALGYTRMGDWHNGEYDSFGPLSRQIFMSKDNKRYTIWYG